MMRLTSHQAGPVRGTADALCVFVHGYGADGRDLLGLSQPLAQRFPNMVFFAPDAPSACAGNPMGFQWFGIPWLDGSDPAQSARDMADAVAQFDRFLDDVALQTAIGADRTVLFGFSQGTMMALHVGPRRKQKLAGIVGFSGRLLNGDELDTQTHSRPPIQLLHGDHDEVVPCSDMHSAAQDLRGAEFDVRTHIMAGTAHGIAPDGLQVAVDFIAEVLR